MIKTDLRLTDEMQAKIWNTRATSCIPRELVLFGYGLENEALIFPFHEQLLTQILRGAFSMTPEAENSQHGRRSAFNSHP
jgi:hypothetical protein